VTKLSI